MGPLESTLARTTTSEVATVLLRQSQCAATEHRAAAAAPDSSGTSVFRSQTTMSATSNNMTTTNQRLPFQRTDSAASGTSSTERSAWEILYAAKGERELDMEFQGVYADAASEEDGSEDGDERERVYGDDDDALRDYMYDYDVEEELADLYDMHGQENLDGSTLALNATNNPFSKMESGEEPPVGHVAVTMAHSKRALLTRLDQLADVDQAPAKKHSAVTDLQDMLAPAAKRLADGDSKSGSKVQSPKPTFADVG